MNRRFPAVGGFLAVTEFPALSRKTRTFAVCAAVALVIGMGIARAQMSPTGSGAAAGGNSSGAAAGAPGAAAGAPPASADLLGLAASTQPAAAVDQTSPKGAIKVLETAILKGDSDGMLHVISASSPEETKVVNAFVNNISAKVALQDAVLTKFPPATGNPGDVKAKQLVDTLGAVDKMTENVAGDDASVGPLGAPDESRLKLKKLDGQWKVPFATMFGGVEQLDQRVDSLNVQTGVLRDLEGDVVAGKFKTVEEMQQAGQQRMIAAALANAAATTRAAGELGATTQGSPQAAGGASAGATTKPGM
jgi:hypothetical protein